MSISFTKVGNSYVNSSELENIEDGDFFYATAESGWGPAVQTLTGCPYDHIGIFIWLKIKRSLEMINSDIKVQNIEKKELYIFHSDIYKRVDALLSREKDGCQLVKFTDLFDHYAKISYRKVKINRDREFKKRFINFIVKYVSYDYDRRPVSLLSAGVGKKLSEDSDSSIYCSELTARFLIEVCDYNELKNKNLSFSPKSFTTFNKSSLFKTFFLSKEILLVRNGDNFETSALKLSLLLTVILVLIVIMLRNMKKK